MKKIVSYTFALLILLLFQSHKPGNGRQKTTRILTDISGTYKSVPTEQETENCDLSVKITKTQGRYSYRFDIAGQVLKGKVTLKEIKGEKGMLIVFEGIKWAEYEGDISDDPEHEHKPKPEMKIPAGVGGKLLNNEITIQNYGNSMNYYVVFAACGQKYISLIKQ
jgi:hypothetical protein